MAGPKFTTLAERFSRYFEASDPTSCWLWKGATSGKYGRICTGKHQQSMLAHRAAWELAYGLIPKGLNVCHRCDVPLCVNPLHLFLGTHADNTRDMMTKGRDSFTGSKHYAAKLTVDQVREIRRSTESACSWARRLGVAPQTIDDVRSRKNWKHVSD